MFPVVRSLFEGGGEATGRGRSVPASSAPLSIISGQQEQHSNLVTPFILPIDPFVIPIKYLQKRKKKIDPFNREPRDLLENFCPTLFHKLFPTDNTTLDLWNVEIDGTSHNCSKCFHPTVTRATLIRRFRSRSRRGSRRLDVWTLLVVQLSAQRASDRPTGIRVDRWARRGFHETVCRRLVKKKKKKLLFEWSKRRCFFFFFFFS